MATSYADSGTQRRSKIAEALLAGGMSAAPVGHWTQGAARVAQALMGGNMVRQADREEAARRAQMSSVVTALLGGDTATPGTTAPGPGLTSVSAPAGPASVNVAQAHAPRFAELMQLLERSGVRIDPSQTSGFANRNIAGTNVPSQHASGRAVDINSRDNPQGALPTPTPLPYDMYGEDAREPTTSIHPDIARDAARRTGMRWGGDFRNAPGGPDPMHFEVAPNARTPRAQRSITAASGASPSASGALNISPGMRAAVSALAKVNPQGALNMLLPLVAKSDQPTEKQRNYAAYARDQISRGEEVLSFHNWDLEGRRAGATAITSQITGERQQDKDLGAARAKTTTEIRAAGDRAYETLGRLNVMRSQMEQPGFHSGFAADAIERGKALIAALGGDDGGVSSMQTFRAQANKIVLDAIGGSLGNQISNADRDFIVAQAPSLELTPEGNQRLMTIMERLARRNIEAADFLDSYVARAGRVDDSFHGALRRWREQNPLFTPEEMAQLRGQGGRREQPAASGATRTRRYNPTTGRLE